MAVLQRIPGLLATGGIPIVPPPPPTPWTPPQMGSGLRGWWDPDTLGLAVDTPVASLGSGGGITNLLGQPTVASRPTYKLLNGKGALYFDNALGHTMLMSDNSVSNAAPALVMAFVYQFATISSAAVERVLMAVRIGTAGSSHRMDVKTQGVSGTAKPIGTSYRNVDSNSAVNNWSLVTADVNPHLLIARIVFAGTPRLDIWQDGTNILGSNPTMLPSAGNLSSGDSLLSYMGGNPAAVPPAATYSINGMIAESLIMRGDIVTDDRQKLEGYWAHKYGLAANLPSDHPWKSAAPTL